MANIKKNIIFDVVFSNEIKPKDVGCKVHEIINDLHKVLPSYDIIIHVDNMYSYY
ncbi:hypothetical protein [Thermobrachium celere]|uniref:hypothetical protein n=1 Tax=Thermobrachium celere TaxID=53422 RepID=UPI001943183F|nr:hypothetical protein [Thermobrachium celere]GFR34822.1 hypothetical protein TCEA9_06340 [Thermobrachium celere]